MKVYTYDPAPNPRRLALFMKYKGIELETHQIDLMSLEQLSDEYRAINPECTVPTLVLDDGTALTQVIGQCTYLEELYPQKPLMGATALEKAQVVSWCHKLFTGLVMAIASVLRNRGSAFADRALPGPVNLPQIPELVDRGLIQIKAILPELDAHLAENTWLCGDNFTFADIDLLTTIGFLGWIKEAIPEEYKHLQDWYERANAQVT